MVDEPKICKWKEFLKKLKGPVLDQAKKLGINDNEYCCIDENSEEDVFFVEI